MNNVGRLEPCPCGSGRRFKHCHGALGATDVETVEIPPAQLENRIREHALESFELQRQQGRTRPIISTVVDGSRHVFVGNRVFRGPWTTFTTFLIDYFKDTFGIDWGNRQLTLPVHARHPVLQWMDALHEQVAKHRGSNDRHVFSVPDVGCLRAIRNLAYDLFLIEHRIRPDQGQRAFDDLLDRLRDPDRFDAARHEARVAAMLLRAGFSVLWEDDAAPDRASHRGGFTATYPTTGRPFRIDWAVGEHKHGGDALALGDVLAASLQQPVPLERVVVLDLNHADAPGVRKEDWQSRAVEQLHALEQDRSYADLPAALVVLLNAPDRHALDELIPDPGMVVEGFRMDRFRVGDRVALAREDDRAIEMERLLQSLGEYGFVPVTFDGSVAGLDESRRLLFGEFYELHEASGVLEEAIVDDGECHAIGFVRTEAGNLRALRVALSDQEMWAWRRQPESFFGILHRPDRRARKPLDLYEFLYAIYRSAPKDKLLALMTDQPDTERLRAMDQAHLAKLYCFRVAAEIGNSPDSPEMPAWLRHLLPLQRDDTDSAPE
ncbi:SEC-C domain-containing protein [Lysobacter sp. TY2-98]|uniref:YecA family protein n=1 Tax=Lysobacter sp. TY2-98 TaxID=2290922 RepID=UPI0013B36781|nr:SEC-C domain-containing protein [Lysobacter sp. TY2-98]